jgi:hypothetical protein
MAGLGLPILPEFPGMGMAETGVPNPVQRMARARTRKIFGLEVPQRRVNSLLGGLANMPRIEPGGGAGNFFQGLSAGLGGAMQAGQQFDMNEQRAAQQEADAERQMVGAELREREIESRIAENHAQAERASRVPTSGSPAPSRGQSLAGMSPEEFAILLEREGQLAGAKRAPARSPSLATPKPPKVPAAKTKKLTDEMGRLDKVTKWEHYLEISQDRTVEPETRQEAFRRYARMRSSSVPAQGR